MFKRIKSILAKKEIEEGKQQDVEKDDMLAIIIAAFSVFLPALLAVIALFAVVILILQFIF